MSKNVIAFSFAPTYIAWNANSCCFFSSFYCLLFCFSIRDPARQTKFYAKEKKKDGSEYEPDSLRVMEASIDRYLRQMNYPDNIITGRPFKTSQEILNSKGKLLWHQSRQGKTTQRSSALQSNGRRRFWIEGKLGNHNGVALTNLKNLSEHRRF